MWVKFFGILSGGLVCGCGSRILIGRLRCVQWGGGRVHTAVDSQRLRWRILVERRGHSCVERIGISGEDEVFCRMVVDFLCVKAIHDAVKIDLVGIVAEDTDGEV